MNAPRLTYSPSGSGLQRRTSPLLFFYVAREYLVPLACCMLVFLLLFITIDFFDVLQDLLEAKAAFAKVALYFALRQPRNMLYVLPLSVLLTAGYMISTFVRHHELTAVRACGISIVRLCLPVWIIAALFSVLSFWLAESVVPACSARAEALSEQLRAGASERPRIHACLAYRNSRANRHWFFERFSSGGVQQGVLITQFRPGRGVAWEVRADQAVYQHRQWVLTNAVRVDYDADGMLPLEAGKVVPTLTLPELTETPKEILNSLRPVEELTIRDMRRLLRADATLPHSTRDVFWTAIWHRLFFPLSCVGAAIIGVAFSIGRDGGSRLRGFSVAVAVLVAYHITSQLFVLLGRNGMIPPIVAGGLPTVVLGVWGIRDLYLKR